MDGTLRTTPAFIVGSDAELADELSRRVSRILEVRGADAWSLAIPGGSVAERLLPLLAKVSLPWARAHVFFVDERGVSPDDPDSNWRLCRHLTVGAPMAS